MRFDPEHRLPEALEYYRWRAARWPAGRHWRLRRKAGAAIDGLALAASMLARLLRGAADFVHGQPQVATRINPASLPQRLNRYTARTIAVPRRPFDPADLDFLATFTRQMPAALDALDPELRRAVLARRVEKRDAGAPPSREAQL